MKKETNIIDYYCDICKGKITTCSSKDPMDENYLKDSITKAKLTTIYHLPIDSKEFGTVEHICPTCKARIENLLWELREEGLAYLAE